MAPDSRTWTDCDCLQNTGHAVRITSSIVGQPGLGLRFGFRSGLELVTREGRVGTCAETRPRKENHKHYCWPACVRYKVLVKVKVRAGVSSKGGDGLYRPWSQGWRSMQGGSVSTVADQFRVLASVRFKVSCMGGARAYVPRDQRWRSKQGDPQAL